MNFKHTIAALAFATLAIVALPLEGCTTVASAVASVATNVASTTPQQVTTLAEALQAATLVTKAVDVYVNTANPNRATLLELKSLNDAVHAALTDLEATNAKGGSLAFGTFNAALKAFNAYATAEGVKH